MSNDTRRVKRNKKETLFQRLKSKLLDRYEEFKLNRQGKTKRKRADVKSRYRKRSKQLTALIIIVALLLIISWVIVLYY